MCVETGAIPMPRRKCPRSWRIAIVVACVLAAGLFGTILCTHHHDNRIPIGTRIDRIVVEKSVRKLSIFRGGEMLKIYQIALGQNPIGKKDEEGDMKTPEGIYRIDARNPKSAYHLALHISYPSDQDNARAAARGVSAGSDIMIHGLPNGEGSLGALHRQIDWTARGLSVDVALRATRRVPSLQHQRRAPQSEATIASGSGRSLTGHTPCAIMPRAMAIEVNRRYLSSCPFSYTADISSHEKIFLRTPIRTAEVT